MARQIYIGLATEGSTDRRFLAGIVERTFQHIALSECRQDIDIFIEALNTSKIDLDFPEFVKCACFDGVRQFGMMSLAIHTDADRDSYEARKAHKIEPAQNLLDSLDENYCKLLTPVIPVRMIEAWMLADKELLKAEIGTKKSDNELGIDRAPEAMADPKQAIVDAIRIATENLPKRRQRLCIGDLYSIIGDKVSIESLEKLDSYRRFEDEVRSTLCALNCMY